MGVIYLELYIYIIIVSHFLIVFLCFPDAVVSAVGGLKVGVSTIGEGNIIA